MEINNKTKRTRQKLAIFEQPGSGQLIMDFIEELTPGLSTADKLFIIQKIRQSYLLELREANKDIKQAEIWKQ